MFDCSGVEEEKEKKMLGRHAVCCWVILVRGCVVTDLFFDDSEIPLNY